MKRLALLSMIVVFAACAPKADDAAPADTTTPAAADTMARDTTAADTTHRDTTAADTTVRP